MQKYKKSPWTYEEAVSSLRSFLEENHANKNFLSDFLLGQIKAVLEFDNWSQSAKIEYIQYLTKAHDEITSA